MKLITKIVLGFIMALFTTACMVSINTNIGSENEMNKAFKTDDFTLDQESGQTMTAEGNR